MSTSDLSELIRRACLLEATAPKPGNVHPQAAFDDLSYEDFVQAGEAIAPILPRVHEQGIGGTILAAVRATRQRLSSPTNVNLGIILLLTPLCAVPPSVTLAEGIEDVLGKLSIADCRATYQAIREAFPGGLGQADTGDVNDESADPDLTLREAMALAAERDSIAAEYTTGYAITLQQAVPWLRQQTGFKDRWAEIIIELQLRLMRDVPDTLIARKCGRELAEEAGRRAGSVLEAGLETVAGQRRLVEFDAWLRADGHRRNPGTSADLIVAALFVAARDEGLDLPSPQIL